MDNASALHDYTLQLADSSLILSQRLCEWCGVAPELEIDLAFSNIGLDLLGEARNYYAYLANKSNGKTEDDFAFLRLEHEYKNILLVEQPNAGFDVSIMRQFLFDTYHVLLLERLQNSSDSALADIAAKSYKEALYHQKFSQEWVIRLGDGTKLSHQKMQAALELLWRYTFEFFEYSSAEEYLINNNIIPDLQEIESIWHHQVQSVLRKAGLFVNEGMAAQRIFGGKVGQHTEHLGYVLAEMQFMQRTYPNMQW